MKIGAICSDNHSCEFTVWAPFVKNISLKILTPSGRLVPMQRDDRGYWKAVVTGAAPGTLYVFRLDEERERPDPASYYQPDGVHSASQVINHSSFTWQDSEWKGITLPHMIMYELHIGTFTHEGTFDAVIGRLDALKDIGINTIEVMPVAQFPGKRNWGYDGVYPFAVHSSYGGPEGLKKLVDACHMKGIAVILDVVYNHLGPEGNYLWDFGPYFTERYKTFWGDAINFDGAYSNEVRSYFINNALYWFTNYHIDALRLDAVHGIYDMSAKHFLAELSERVDEFSKQQGRKFYLIAESDLNNPVVARPKEKGGYGIDGIWNDDFHHAVHTLLTHEDEGYYIDFGKTGHLVKSLMEGYIYSGQYSEFRKRNHGNSSREIPAGRIVVFSQNHDQTGNRMNGERLSQIVSFEAQKLSAGIVLLSPYVPLLFMGEEYGETAPFLYFISHSDARLIEGIREGRKKDFEVFKWEDDPPDPQDISTFERSRINWDSRSGGNNKLMLEFYRELIRLRNGIPALAHPDKNSLDVWHDEEKKVVFMRRWKDNSNVLALFNFNTTDIQTGPVNDSRQYKLIIESSDVRWNGPGTLLPEELKHDSEITLRAESVALYVNIVEP